MNYFKLIIVHEKHPTGFNYAIDANLVLPLTETGLTTSGYQDGLTQWHAESIMRKLIRFLDGQPVSARVTDHT
ncbi:hypothetical protein DQ158_08360 [Escherichia coli]|nr:hypothetical protein [Escherichia coli]